MRRKNLHAQFFLFVLAAANAIAQPPSSTDVKQPVAEILTENPATALPECKGGIGQMALDLVRNRLFILCPDENAVAVFDMGEKKLIKRIEQLPKPAGIAHLPGLDLMAVSCAGDGTVRLFNGSALDQARSVEIGKEPSAMVFDSKLRLIFVGYAAPGIISFDPTDGKKGKKIDTISAVSAMFNEANGPRIFAPVPIGMHVAVVDRTRNLTTTNLLVRAAREISAVAHDETGKRLFVAGKSPARVEVLDSENGKSMGSLEIAPQCRDIWFDGVARRLYASGDGTITIIEQKSPDHYEVVANVSTAPGAARSMWIKETRTLYVAVPAKGDTPAQLISYKAAP